MKSKDELKKESQKLIDSKKNESAQDNLKDNSDSSAGDHKEEDTYDDLSAEEKSQLNKAIAEGGKSDPVTMDEFKEALRRWRNGLSPEENQAEI